MQATLVFTRMLDGPMDFTPGVFVMNTKSGEKIATTLAKQLALYVVIYSPLQMAVDLPEHYEARMGAVTDGEARGLQVPLSFLDAGRRYTAQIYRDGPDAGWQHNQTDLEIEEREVGAGDTLTLRLAPGGGQAIRFVAD